MAPWRHGLKTMTRKGFGVKFFTNCILFRGLVLIWETARHALSEFRNQSKRKKLLEKYLDTRHNDTQNNNIHYRYADCRYAECRGVNIAESQLM